VLEQSNVGDVHDPPGAATGVTFSAVDKRGSQMTSGEKDSSLEESVKARAYAIWEGEGKPEGRHLEHWRRAMDEIAPEAVDAVAPTKAPPARRNSKTKTR
jgi:Protein of unknown function (DUF2934)